MLVADPWLLDLAVSGIQSRIVAALLLRTQVRTYKRTGHLMELGTESVKRRVFWAAKHGQVPNALVRCSRCGVAAYLPAWIKADGDGLPPLPEIILALHDGATQPAIAFQLPCEGNRMAQGLAAILSPSLKDVQGEG